MKRYTLTESRLRSLVREAVKSVLKETPLNYDEDNFSGRHYKNIPDDFIDPEGCLDDPNGREEIERNMYYSDYYDEFPTTKDAENNYSWAQFDNKSIAPGAFGGYDVSKRGVDNEVNDILTARNRKGQWLGKELRNRNRNMERWVQGRRTPDDIGDSWEDLHDFA